MVSIFFVLETQTCFHVDCKKKNCLSLSLSLSLWFFLSLYVCFFRRFMQVSLLPHSSITIFKLGFLHCPRGACLVITSWKPSLCVGTHTAKSVRFRTKAIFLPTKEPKVIQIVRDIHQRTYSFWSVSKHCVWGSCFQIWWSEGDPVRPSPAPIKFFCWISKCELQKKRVPDTVHNFWICL